MADIEITGIIEEVFTEDEEDINSLEETNEIIEPEDDPTIPTEDTDTGEASDETAETVTDGDVVEPDEEDTINAEEENDLTEAEIIAEEQEVEPIISNTETLPTIGNIEAGDRVMIALIDGEPTVLGTVGSGDRQQTEINTISADVAELGTVVAGKASIGDLNAQTARIDDLETTKADVTELNAATGRITTLETENTNVKGRLSAAEGNITSLTTNKANVTDLNAATARIGTLETDNTNVKGRLTAAEGNITNLNANKVNTTDLEANYITSNQIAANYAKVDATNINTATIQDAWVAALLVQTGLLAHSGTIYTLDAIQLNADRITAGTIDVQRLVVTVDGHKYLVQFDSQGRPQYQKLDGDVIEDLTITADKIVAGAVTAEKITTENIVGTGGWINLRNGTFNYTNATSGEGISWDGTHLNIKAQQINIGTTNVLTTINSAVSTANSAASDAASAVSTANTAASNAASAVSTANTASSNASTAVSTANAAKQAATESATSAKAYAEAAASSASDASDSASAASDSASAASDSASAASDSATAASDSASAASTSESNAASSASTASTKASQASTSATNAASSASAAAGSATTASQKATAAASSASAAATSESNAASSASTASTKASQASTSATNAASSATAAATSESNAAQSASDASDSADAASTSASTASTKASEAASSASTASTKASQAATSASTASTKASQAATSATTASTKASEAATSASTASTKATEAANSATTATTKAGEAATSASTASTKATQASTSATNAATSASNASDSADRAEEAATGAEDSAATAVTTANEAKGLATTANTNASTANTNAATALSAVQEVQTLIRQYEDGVLVCKNGQQVGSLVNADGSFDVVSIDWSTGVPTASEVLAQFGADGARIGNLNSARTEILETETSFYGNGGAQVGKISYTGQDAESFTEKCSVLNTLINESLTVPASIYRGNLKYEPLSDIVVNGYYNGTYISPVTIDYTQDYSATIDGISYEYDATNNSLSMNALNAIPTQKSNFIGFNTAPYENDYLKVSPEYSATTSKPITVTLKNTILNGYEFQIYNLWDYEYETPMTFTVGTSATKTVSMKGIMGNDSVKGVYNATKKTITITPTGSSTAVDLGTLKYYANLATWKEFTLTYDRFYASPQYTFGVNNDNNEAALSMLIGEGLVADNPHEVIVGKYNTPSLLAQFVVADGTDNENRSNLFTVKSTGDIIAKGGISAYDMIDTFGDIKTYKSFMTTKDNGIYLSDDTDGSRIYAYDNGTTASNSIMYKAYGTNAYHAFYAQGKNSLYIQDNRINSNVPYYCDAKSLFSVKTVSKDNISIAASSATQDTFSVAVSGYRPIAIAGFDLDNASSSGANVSRTIPIAIKVSGNSCLYQLANQSTSAAKVKLNVTVLYVPDTQTCPTLS